MRIDLSVIRGPHQGRVFTFDAHDTFIVGRGKQAHFRLPAKDPYFSRIHFMVEMNPPLCRLFDMNSTNGTFVNQKRVARHDLVDGDEITGGDTVIRVAMAGDLATTQPESGAPLPAEAVATRIERPSNETRPSPTVIVTDSDRRRTLVEPVPPLSAEPEPANAGQPLPAQFGNYRVLRRLGSGGMGIVYLAARDDGTELAIKTVLPAVPGAPKDVQRFLRESSILQQLEHPHIVRFLDQGATGGLLWFAMEYVPGENVATWIERKGQLPVQASVGLICQLLTALEFAHGLKFVHRDVKPENILVKTGKPIQAKLADFGLARVYQASRLSGLTLHGQMGGSLAYMAPEQVTHYRDSNPACDQYSAAATLYRMLTGQHIFDFPDAFHERILIILQDNPVPILQRRPDLPAGIAAAIEKALARSPDDRFASCAAFREALISAARAPS